MVLSVGDISEDDIADVARFLARQTRPGEAVGASPMTAERRLRWLLLENPSRASDIPLGWRIRDDGTVVGAAVCMPFRIGAGDFRATALQFAKFFVDADYRGMGLGILMRFVHEGRRFPLFCTSTNAKSGELFFRLGGSLIAGLDHTMLGIVRPAPLIDEWLFRRTRRPLLARRLASPIPAMMAPARRLARRRDLIRGVNLFPLHDVEEAAAIGLPPPAAALAIVRDREYLRWRYFSGERERDVYCFRRKSECDRLVVVEEIRSGYRGQIRVLNVLDIWPPPTPDSTAPLAAALAHRYRGRFDTIWMRGQSPAAEKALGAAGFLRHVFPAPLGWFIDSENRLPTNQWYLMPGESE
ncbi:MAG TPA: hypothetical protein VG326_16730 [Tepidisphaeraceae bacterium]|nr:hypothetical protein [Tepidisphaeraceae bacterium]